MKHTATNYETDGNQLWNTRQPTMKQTANDYETHG